MTLIELFLLLVFIGGGAFFGGNLVGWLGVPLGAGLGFALLLALSWWAREGYPWPGCRCGASGREAFQLVEHSQHYMVHRCRRCGLLYLMQRTRRWDEVLPKGSLRPYMRRGFLGSWKVVTGADPDGDAEV